MIKTICFDLGDDKELYLTIDEIIKLQAAFRFVCLDNRNGSIDKQPGIAAANPLAQTYAEKVREAEKRRQESAARFNQYQQTNSPPISNPFPKFDINQELIKVRVDREAIEAAKANQDAFTRAAEASITRSIERLGNGS